MTNKKVFLSVTNDLSTDQRVHKVSNFLTKNGFDVCLVGRKKRNSRPLENRDYQTLRMKLIFERGFLFYAEFNLRLFVLLLFKKADLLVSNDLDTLLPNFLVSKIRKIPLVYDSHEYFTEVPEIINRKIVKKVWTKIEEAIFPRLQNVITVNDSIAGLFKDKYKKEIVVVRNMPEYIQINTKTRKELGLPVDKHIILLQGSGINIDRGGEEAVQSMQFIENALLLIIGDGDVINDLKQMTIDLSLQAKIQFLSRMNYGELMMYTANADLGLTLDKDTNINYRFSLPNKLFDYIQAGIPVLASRLPEIEKIIHQYQIGDFIENHSPEHIAGKINQMLANKENYKIWKENSIIAARELTWENEEQQLLKVYLQFFQAH